MDVKKLYVFMYSILLAVRRTRSTDAYAPFARRGRIFRTTAVVDLHFAVDLSSINQICTQISGNFSHSYWPKETKTFELWRKQTLEEIAALCNEPIFGFGVKEADRERRSLLVAVALGAVGAWVADKIFSSSSHSATVNDHNLKVIDKEVANLQNLARITIMSINRQKNKAEKEFRLEQFRTKLQHVSTKVKGLSSGFARLLQGSLSPEIVSLSQAHVLLETLENIARKVKAEVPFSDAMFLYLFPVKHQVHRGRFDFYISVPLVESSYSNWKFLHHPIVFKGGQGPVFLSARPEHDILAREEPTGKVIVLSDGDLEHCVVWEHDYFCSFLPMEKEDLCLKDLFQFPERAPKSCDFVKPGFEEFLLTHIDENEFLLSLNSSSLKIEQKCDNGTTFFALQRGQHRLRVPSGCMLFSPVFTIPRFTPIKQVALIRLHPFPADIAGLPLPEEEIKQLSPDFSLLQHKRLQESTGSWLPSWLIHLLQAVATMVFVVILLVCLRQWYARKR